MSVPAAAATAVARVLRPHPWQPRAAVLVGVTVITRVLLGSAILHAPERGSLWRALAFAVVVAVPLIWGIVDGHRAYRALSAEDLEDPKAGADLTMRWLAVAVATALVAAVVAWACSLFPGLTLTAESLLTELTSGAAFTVLAVFVPAQVGAALVRLRIRLLEHRATRARTTQPA